MTAPALAQALQQSDRLWTRAQLLAAIERIGGELDRVYAGASEPPVFLTVMNGGMFFAAYLAHASKIDFHFDYVHATRYRSGTLGHALELVKAPRTPLAGRDVLLVDDILDEGKTLSMLRDWCVAQGAAPGLVAVVTLAWLIIMAGAVVGALCWAGAAWAWRLIPQVTPGPSAGSTPRSARPAAG